MEWTREGASRAMNLEQEWWPATYDEAVVEMAITEAEERVIGDFARAASERLEGFLAAWATWEVVRGLGGSLDDPRYRRAQLRYALEVA